MQLAFQQKLCQKELQAIGSLIAPERKVPQRSDASQNDHKSKGYPSKTSEAFTMQNADKGDFRRLARPPLKQTFNNPTFQLQYEAIFISDPSPIVALPSRHITMPLCAFVANAEFWTVLGAVATPVPKGKSNPIQASKSLPNCHQHSSLS